MSLSAVLQSITGRKPGTTFSVGGVPYSGEFRRIESLPRRVWEEDASIKKAIKLIENELRISNEMGLFDIQGAALYDIANEQGAFLPIGVGQGKTLISILASSVLEAKRPVLFVPASLRDQTFDHVLPRMKKHWKLPKNLKIIGYSELSLAKNADMLNKLKPDVIILDECQSVKNTRTGRGKRLVRWFRENPETKCVAMSGTISSRSIKDFAHIIRWCLKDRAPVPSRYHELCSWADALDSRIPSSQRVPPGALMRFCNEGENARQGFRRRLVQTPGVVASRENDLGCSLVLDKAELKLKPSEKILAALAKSRLLWERPDGHLMVEAIEQWQMMRSLALGFWYRWDPAPPDDWCEANKAWRTFVQLTLRNNRRGLDTELQVWNDCERNSASLPTYHPFFDWKNIKETFKPNPVPQWIDDFAVDACIEWMKGCKTDAPGIVWTESIAFGDRVAEKSGLPYFGAGKSSIINFRGPCAIASISAHGEGKELQHFSRNLIVSPPSSGKIWEQLLGRTHRHGQEADSVSCEILLYTPEQIASLQHALEDAQYLEHTYGNRQKLNFASRTKSLDMLVTVC